MDVEPLDFFAIKLFSYMKKVTELSKRINKK